MEEKFLTTTLTIQKGGHYKMINFTKTSACLTTKDAIYPHEVLDNVLKHPFGEVLILTNCDSPHRKHELFAKAKYDLIYYQDDDAICPIAELAWLSDPKMINVAMKQGHFESYADKKMTMGLGWGAIFPKNILKSLEKYTNIYGFDEIYKRETERILTSLNFPQNRLVLPIKDLPSAYAQDRLWRQPKHYDYIPVVEERCKDL